MAVEPVARLREVQMTEWLATFGMTWVIMDLIGPLMDRARKYIAGRKTR